jgi:DNA-binding XRE family transcriptional regulator
LQLRNIENGKVNTSVKMMYNVAKVFGLNPAQFLVQVESEELLAEK